MDVHLVVGEDWGQATDVMISIRRAVTQFRKRIDLAILAIAVISYTVYWSELTTSKVYALTATNFDLGSGLQIGWLAFHEGGDFRAWFYLFLGQPTAIVFSPLSLPQSFSLLLTLQAFAIGAAVVPLYAIGRYHRLPIGIALPIALSYLFYFPLAGMNWFDFHYETLMMLFLFLGYYAFLRERYALAGVLLFLAGGVRFPYLILPAIFSVIIGIEELPGLLRSRFRVIPPRAAFAIAFTLVCVATLILSYIVIGQANAVGSIHSSSSPSLFYDFENKLLTIGLLFAPFMALPLFSKRWVPCLLPFIALDLFVNNGLYVYPSAFTLQYAVLFVPFLYLGTVDVLSGWSDHSSAKSAGVSYRAARTWIRTPRSRTILTLIVIVNMVALACVFEPYGPLNPGSAVDFQLGPATDVNLTRYDSLQTLMSLIPPDDPFVLFQNNMPALMVRHFDYDNTPLIAGSTIRTNLSILTPSGEWARPPINYIIDDPFSFWFYFDYPDHPSMYTLLTDLYRSGSFGLVAEASGMAVYERNYTGTPALLVPLSTYFPANEFWNGSTALPVQGDHVSGDNVSGATVWFGPSTALAPGLYRLTFHLRTTSLSPTNRIDLQVSANSGGVVVWHDTLNGSAFSGRGVWTQFSFMVPVNSTYGYVEFRGVNAYWTGQISFQGLAVDQISAIS